MKAVIRSLCLALLTVASSAFAFEAGEGVVDISPPVGTALGGYHYGDPNSAYEATVEAAMLRAIELAKTDLAAATLRVGSASVVRGSKNRTLRTSVELLQQLRTTK